MVTPGSALHLAAHSSGSCAGSCVGGWLSGILASAGGHWISSCASASRGGCIGGAQCRHWVDRYERIPLHPGQMPCSHLRSMLAPTSPSFCPQCLETTCLTRPLGCVAVYFGTQRASDCISALPGGIRLRRPRCSCVFTLCRFAGVVKSVIASVARCGLAGHGLRVPRGLGLPNAGHECTEAILSFNALLFSSRQPAPAFWSHTARASCQLLLEAEA